MVRGSGSGCATVQPGAARFWNKNFLDYHPAHGFSDRLSIADRVMGAARGLPVEKRDIFLQRIAAMLALRGRGHFNDSDVMEVAPAWATVLLRLPRK